MIKCVQNMPLTNAWRILWDDFAEIDLYIVATVDDQLIADHTSFVTGWLIM